MSRNAQIRFATSILARLGEELTPSPDLGILELVKNAYDADARECVIEMVNIDSPGGMIRICDDGDGMESDDIISGWLVLGRSQKIAQKRTRLNRIPAGNKGLGRLAALRMGNRVELITRPRIADGIANHQYMLDIDWENYERADLVDDVVLEIGEVPCQHCKHGTDVVIRDLRQQLKRNDVMKLARGLLLLADPFADNPYGFQPVLKTSEFKDLEKLVQRRYFDQAEFHLIAELNEQGYAYARALDWRGEELFTGSHENIASDKDKLPYDCPQARFEIWIFVLDAKAFSTRPVTISEVRAWLKEFGGIHLYQNGLRVSPYGNPGNDWLEMNLLRAKNPEERPSTNTVIGRVLVYDENEELIQKTDRAGFIETDKFDQLRQFAQDSLEWLAFRRIEEREKRRVKERTEAPKRSKGKKANVEVAIQNLPPTQRGEINEAFRSYDRAREHEVRQLREEVQLYRTLSTAGITAATFAHESSGNPIKVIGQAIKTIERRAKQALEGRYEASQIDKPIQLVRQSIASLAVLGSTTLRLVDHEKRRVGRVDVHKVIEEVLDVFKPFLDGRGVNVQMHFCSGNPYLQGSAAAIESVITNLLNNSLIAFEAAAVKNREIRVYTELENENLVIRVLDSGPGIDIAQISLREIWLPGKSTRPNGTGLGLTIVRDAVSDLGGSVEAIPQSELGGAELIMKLPIIGV